MQEMHTRLGLTALNTACSSLVYHYTAERCHKAFIMTGIKISMIHMEYFLYKAPR